MSFVIEGGRVANKAFVDHDERLHTYTIMQPSITEQAIDGHSWFIGTGITNLPDANEHALLYIVNNSQNTWIVNRVAFLFGISTGGAGDAVFTYYANATGGTLVTSGIDAPIGTTNIGIPNTIEGAAKIGVVGVSDTLTGQPFSQLAINNPAKEGADFDIFIMEPGTNVGLACTAPPGNTAMNAQFLFYFTEQESF